MAKRKIADMTGGPHGSQGVRGKIGEGAEGVKNGIGIAKPYQPTIKVSGASPGFDAFTHSIAKGRSMSVGPIEIEKTTFTPKGGSEMTYAKGIRKV